MQKPQPESLTRALRVIAAAERPITSRQLAEAVGIDYVRNFNKREKRYARRLAGFVVRRRLQADEMQAPTRLLHWLLDTPWRGMPTDAIVQAFTAGAVPPSMTRALPPHVEDAPAPVF